jgi:hypothetical protein
MLSSMPPAYKAEVVQARLKRRTVVLTAVCALGVSVFTLAAVRGIQRHQSAASPAHTAIAVTRALEPPATSPSASQSAAPSISSQPREPAPASTRADRPTTASPAKQAPPTGIAASPPRAKRAPSKTNFEL